MLNVTHVQHRGRAMIGDKEIEGKTVSKRVAVYLPDGVYELLERFAEKEKRSSSSLAAYLIESGVRQMEKLEIERSRVESESRGG